MKISILSRLVRIPIDIFLLTFHYLKGLLWLLDYTIRSLLNFPQDQSFPYGCFSEKTPSGHNACLPGKKYGNSLLFKALCPDCKRTKKEEEGTYCLTRLLTKHNYWRPSIFRLCCVGIFLLFVWLTIGFCLFQGIRRVLPASIKSTIRLEISNWPWKKIENQKLEISEKDKKKSSTFLKNANKLSAEGKHEEAVLEFRNAVKSNPLDPAIFFALGNCFLRLNQEEEAVNAFAQSLKLNTQNWEAHYQLGKLYIKFGVLEKATEHAQAALELNSEAVEGHLLACACQIRKGEIQKAREEMEIVKRLINNLALKENSDNDLFAAQLSFLLKDYATSVELYKKSLETKPDWVEARVGLATVFGATSKFEKAQEELDRILNKDPNNLQARAFQIELKVLKGENSEAINALEKLIELAPTKKKFKLRLAELCIAIGRADEAYVTLNEILKENPSDTNALLILANMYVAKKLYAQAIEYAQRVKVINSKDAHANVLLIKALLGQKNYIKAIITIEEILIHYPKHFDLLLLLGRAHQQTDNEEEAIKIYKKLIEYHPDSTIPYLDLAGLLFEKGQFEEAVVMYEKVLEMAPDNPIASNNLAMLLLEGENGSTRAIEIARQLHQRFPDNPYIADTLGWAYFHSREYGKAQDLLTYATEKRPNSPSIHYHLAETLWKNGEIEKAHQSAKNALRLSNNFKGIVQTQKLLKSIEERLR